MSSRVAASLEAFGTEGHYRLSGVLDFETVPKLLQESLNLFKGSPDVEIDLSAVTNSNSAGLGLLLEWMRQSRLVDRRIRFRHMPVGMFAVAQASDLDKVIPIIE